MNALAIAQLLNHLGDGKHSFVESVLTRALLNHLGDGKLD